jgi:hypothetical protein
MDSPIKLPIRRSNFKYAIVPVLANQLLNSRNDKSTIAYLPFQTHQINAESRFFAGTSIPLVTTTLPFVEKRFAEIFFAKKKWIFFTKKNLANFFQRRIRYTQVLISSKVIILCKSRVSFVKILFGVSFVKFDLMLIKFVYIIQCVSNLNQSLVRSFHII